MNISVSPYKEGFPKHFAMTINQQPVTVCIRAISSPLSLPFFSQDAFKERQRAVDITPYLRLGVNPFRQAIDVSGILSRVA